jgi:hypothetical protein
MPVKVSRGPEHAEQLLNAYSIGTGGLAFRCASAVDPGTVVHLRIPYVEPEFAAEARVVWSASDTNGAELGVEFLNSGDAFRARMVEQICHIENYRQQVLNSEGRALSPEEAAAEWVAKFAESFPDPGSEPVK